MYTGNAVGKGFEQSGKNSAYLKTVDYTGFQSASLGIGSSGVMFLVVLYYLVVVMIMTV